MHTFRAKPYTVSLTDTRSGCTKTSSPLISPRPLPSPHHCSRRVYSTDGNASAMAPTPRSTEPDPEPTTAPETEEPVASPTTRSTPVLVAEELLPLLNLPRRGKRRGQSPLPLLNQPWPQTRRSSQCTTATRLPQSPQWTVWASPCWRSRRWRWAQLHSRRPWLFRCRMGSATTP